MCSCWVCCENRQARQYWHIYNYFFAMTNHMFIIFSRVAVLLRFAQLMIFWQLKLFVQIKVTTVQLVRFKILYLDICYETVIEFCLLQEWYCTLESGINIRVRLLILEVFSRGYVLIKGGYVYWFLKFFLEFLSFFSFGYV